MKPSLERAAPAASAVPMTPIPSFARKIILDSGNYFDTARALQVRQQVICAVLLLGVARIDPDAHGFIVTTYSHQGHVSDTLKGLDGGLDVELVLVGIGNQRFGNFPGDGHVHVLVAFPIDHMHDQLPMFFRDADVIACVLHGDKFALWRGFQSVQNRADVHVIGSEVADVNFAVTKFAVTYGGGYFFSEHQRHIDSDQLVSGRGSDSYIPKNGCGRRPGNTGG